MLVKGATYQQENEHIQHVNDDISVQIQSDIFFQLINTVKIDRENDTLIEYELACEDLGVRGRYLRHA